MKINYLYQLTILGFSLLFPHAYASPQTINANPASTQYVTIFNSLANPTNSNRTQTPVLIKFFDGSGTKPPCWTYTYKYHNEIGTETVVGAGSTNACGVNTSPPAIVKLQIIPQKTLLNDQAYDATPLDVTLVNNPSSTSPLSFYYNVYVEQASSPKVDPNTGELSNGKIKAMVCTSDHPVNCSTFSQ